MKTIWIWIWRLQLKKLIWFCLHFHWWRKKIFWICTIICGLVKCIFEFFKGSDLKKIWHLMNEKVFFFLLRIYIFFSQFSYYTYLYIVTVSKGNDFTTLYMWAIWRLIVQFCASPGSVTYVTCLSCECLWWYITK